MKMQAPLGIGAIVTAALLLLTPNAHAACKDCGVVAEVKTITRKPATTASTATPVDATTTYQVIVKLENGKIRTFSFLRPPEFAAGDKVRIVQGMKLEKR
jgi:hypothetical protein